MEKLKLYVWEYVLTDYTDGIMIAYARDVDHARELLIKYDPYVRKKDLEKEPREVKTPEGIAVWGGG